MNSSRTILISMLSVLFGLTACVQTELTPPIIHAKILELQNLPSLRPIELAMEVSVDGYLGHQYLLFFIPFGRIQHSSLPNAISTAFITQLTLSGYKPVLNNKLTSPNYLTLLVNVKDVQLTAYDLFFLRRIYCRMELEGTLQSSNGMPLRTEWMRVEESAYKPFAFERELKNIMEKTVDSGVNGLLRKLRLSK